MGLYICLAASSLMACQPVAQAAAPAFQSSPIPMGQATSIPTQVLEIPTSTPAVIPLPPDVTTTPDPSSQPLQFTFPSPGPPLASGWRPPLYDIPWAPGPLDHFYFHRPIAANVVNWPLPDYRYGGIEEGSDIVHSGIDIDIPEDTPVFAAADGTVVWVGYGLFKGQYDSQDPYGLAVALRHDFGYQGQRLYTVYAHLRETKVVVGQVVNQGEQLGLSGQTGRVTGPHLHFEVRLGDNAFWATRNPELWLAPPQGWGVLVGRMMNADGTWLVSHDVLVTSHETGQTWSARTYGPSSVNRDAYYQENLVISDLPAGAYRITVVYYGVRMEEDVQIKPGLVTFFRFAGWNHYNQNPPEDPAPFLTPAP